MATVINTTPATQTDTSGSGVAVAFGIIVAIILGFLFFVYGLPYLRSSLAPSDNSMRIEINAPTPQDAGILNGQQTQ